MCIHLRIVAVLAQRPVDITASQVNTLELIPALLSLAACGDGIAHISFITFIFLITPTTRRP
jgi:hypothetical protein